MPLDVGARNSHQASESTGLSRRASNLLCDPDCQGYVTMVAKETPWQVSPPWVALPPDWTLFRCTAELWGRRRSYRADLNLDIGRGFFSELWADAWRVHADSALALLESTPTTESCSQEEHMELICGYEGGKAPFLRNKGYLDGSLHYLRE
ncbi:hypothetical protein MGYG_07173 [Nannizzia gypsea CBS 118893]|uniref:Uncharacterized protein n=1 Tax=Arthroderma gypseum (strain ATCC MYA-4604 / CBS 118893) TaxID=535722 RepID=E4V2A1_ARTGP|nr:hypothetical protein MGYG_07173 [Nannizzia gypsea CBS 118893]EFR04166.1 hypothetical protein MGYG_07173 [Nannizzia gypsea CBS 118893]